MRFAVPDLGWDEMKYPKAVRRAVAQKREAVWQAHREHNERIRPLLPPSLQQLLETKLHDARIRSLRIDPGQKTLHVSLYYCDTPGCLDINLFYKEIELSPQEISLLCLTAYVDADIYWGEIDREAGADPPVFLHRILWQTEVQTDREPAGVGLDGEALYATYQLDPEIELRFGGFEMEVTPNPEGEFSRTDDFITVVRDPDEVVKSVAAFIQPKSNAL